MHGASCLHAKHCSRCGPALVCGRPSDRRSQAAQSILQTVDGLLVCICFAAAPALAAAALSGQRGLGSTLWSEGPAAAPCDHRGAAGERTFTVPSACLPTCQRPPPAACEHSPSMPMPWPPAGQVCGALHPAGLACVFSGPVRVGAKLSEVKQQDEIPAASYKEPADVRPRVHMACHHTSKVLSTLQTPSPHLSHSHSWLSDEAFKRSAGGSGTERQWHKAYWFEQLTVEKLVGGLRGHGACPPGPQSRPAAPEKTLLWLSVRCESGGDITCLTPPEC